MPVFEILSLTLLALLAWLWLDSLKAREVCLRECRAACRAEGWLLLDDTVAINRIRAARDDGGQLRLRREYRFEYSDNGDNRRTGVVVLLAHRVESMYLGPRAV